MKILPRLLPLTFLLSPLLPAQTSPQNPVRLQSIDILSDTHGADLTPYLHKLTKLLNTAAAPKPFTPASVADISLTIDPTGRITAMHLDSSSHNVTFDKAAWSTLTANTALPAPPTAPLQLLLHFTAN